MVVFKVKLKGLPYNFKHFTDGLIIKAGGEQKRIDGRLTGQYSYRVDFFEVIDNFFQRCFMKIKASCFPCQVILIGIDRFYKLP